MLFLLHDKTVGDPTALLAEKAKSIVGMCIVSKTQGILPL